MIKVEELFKIYHRCIMIMECKRCKSIYGIKNTLCEDQMKENSYR